MNALRSFIFAIWLYGSMTAIGLVFAPFAVFSRQAARLAIRAWAGATIVGLRLVCGVKVVFRGLENIPDGPVLIAAKHQSMLDTIAPFWPLAALTPVLKAELLKTPIYGWFVSRARFIAVERETHASALKSMVRAARASVAEGQSILIFPEGTRQEIDAPADYKPGIAALYKDLALPCVPVALNTGLVWPAHGFRRRPGVAVFDFLEPIPPGLERAAFMALLQQRIEDRTDALVRQAAPR